jgi:Caspase domain/RDD family
VSGQRKALIVANDEYDQEALRDLLAPAADAEALGRVLGDRQIGEFTVEVVRNEPAHVIQAHIEELFSESRPDDVLLIHFSGHGLKSESGELFFAASNTRPNRLGSTAVSADFVQRCMRASRSRSVVLLLDCCYGGAFAQGVKVRAAGDVNVLDSFPQERTGGGRGRAVITASSAMEYAFEGDQLADDRRRRPSVFTSALVEGLATGDADRDEDGWVSLNELYDYVFDKVREQNPHQTPSRQVELEGDLYLARSRRRRIRPAPIPRDLQAAIADPNMYTRLGAVSELQSRLTSEDLPVAAGAYEALAELARADIRYVADPAAAALSQAALHPEETALHFGRIEHGSAPPHRPVRLLGPPIARACAPRASDDWIHVDETAEGFDISVDTANTGTMHGTLELKGPAGEAVIAIEVELFPPTPQLPLQPQNESADHRLAAMGGTGQPEGQSAAADRQEGQLRADSGQANPPDPPKLELSATMIDFGQLSLYSEPPERRVQLGNAGGGNLNARAATQVHWLKLRQDGDELVVSIDTSAAGKRQSAVTVDSDGGSATIRVQARVVVPDMPTEENADTHRAAGTQAPPAPTETRRRRKGREQVPATRLKTAAQPPGRQVQAQAAAPKLALSPLDVDFGHMLVGSKPSPRRVTVRNAGGGDLNARIASAPAWIQAEHTGDTLILKAQPKAPGSLIGDILIDSDGGSATIRVTATIDSPGFPDPPGYYQGDKLATWLQRVGALLIDFVAAYSLPLVFWIVGGNNQAGGGGVVVTLGFFVLIAIWLYNRSYLQGRTGRSWGKRALGLKLIHMSDKGPIGIWQAAVRDLAHALDIPILYLLPIWDAQRQTLADKAIKSVVISPVVSELIAKRDVSPSGPDSLPSDRVEPGLPTPGHTSDRSHVTGVRPMDG